MRVRGPAVILRDKEGVRPGWVKTGGSFGSSAMLLVTAMFTVCVTSGLTPSLTVIVNIVDVVGTGIHPEGPRSPAA